MLLLIRQRCFVAVFLFNLCIVLGKDILLPKCVKIVSINTPLDDPTRAAENYGLHADKKKVVLSDTPGIFKVHKGLLKENGTVSLEALFHPKYFLRHKNYHFHLEKEDNNSVFFKDATFFILKVTENPALYAFELYSHPTWFMRHLKNKPYKVVLSKVKESSKEVMDSTFYLAPHKCHRKKKHESNAEKKTLLVGTGTFIDTADEPDEDTDIKIAQDSDLHAEDFDKSFSSKDPDDLGDSIRIHTEEGDNEPIQIHTELSDVKSDYHSDSDSDKDESSEDIVKEVEEAFRISQNSNNSSYLEKIEKDIQEKVDAIAQIASQDPKNQTEHAGKNQATKDKPQDPKIQTEHAEKYQGTKDKPRYPKKQTEHAEKNQGTKDKQLDNIEIHTEMDMAPSVKPTEKLPKIIKEERTQRVEVMDPRPVIKKDPGEDDSELIEINKDIVVTGKPKLKGNVVIDTTYRYKHPQKTTHKENNVNTENITGFDVDDVSSMKTHLNATQGHVETKMPVHAHSKGSYHDYAEAHKVLNKNIEKLKNVLNAIDDVPVNNRVNEQGIEMVKKNGGSLGSNPSSNNSEVTTVLHVTGTPLDSNIPYFLPPGFKALKSQSTTQTTVKQIPGLPTDVQLASPTTKTSIGKANLFQSAAANQSELPHTSGVPLDVHAQPVLDVTSPGLHVVQGNGNPPNVSVGTQASADVVDHIAHALVDHSPGSQSNSQASADVAGHMANALVDHSPGSQSNSQASANVVGHMANALVDHSPGSQSNSQASANVMGHMANVLVDHSPVRQSNVRNHSPNHWVHMLHPHNKTLQETFKELTPDNTKIFYLGQCEDRFPKACEEWAAQRYCLTFGELMKRYCRKACKICNHVLATFFTPCDKTCGGGVRLRMIKVNNRQVLQRRSCNVNKCPIHGGYTPYSPWSECSVTCGEGVRYRHRSCTNPKPQFGGHDCSHFGPPVGTMPCIKGCKGFKPPKHHSFSTAKFPKGKHHNYDRLDTDEFPEYKAEESNAKISQAVGENESDLDNEGDEDSGSSNPPSVGDNESDLDNDGDEDSGSSNPPSGDGHEFKWPNKHQRKKPVVLDHVHKNTYKHRDDHGNSHYLQVDEEQNPDDEIQTHVVRYGGQQVARMQCGPSRLLQYHKNVPNVPSGYKRSNAFKMYEGGEIVYDKDGVPSDTTKNIVEAFDSPYKIILEKNKNNQMKVMEQCIESDTSVNPDNDLKDDAQSYAGATSLGSEQHSFPANSRLTTDETSNDSFTNNGLYEYKYQDIGQGVDEEKPLGKDVTDQLSRVINKENEGITQRFFRNQDPKPTLNEELAAEKEEETRENKYEDFVARNSKTFSGS